MLNGLPLNAKFKNRYDKKCYIYKKAVDEDLSHLFFVCCKAKSCFDFIRSFLTNKDLDIYLDIIQYKYTLNKRYCGISSICVSAIWQTRNILKDWSLTLLIFLKTFLTNGL